MSEAKADQQKSDSVTDLDRMKMAHGHDVSGHCRVLLEMLMTAQVPMARAEDYCDIKRWLESMIDG